MLKQICAGALGESSCDQEHKTKPVRTDNSLDATGSIKNHIMTKVGNANISEHSPKKFASIICVCFFIAFSLRCSFALIPICKFFVVCFNDFRAVVSSSYVFVLILYQIELVQGF